MTQPEKVMTACPSCGSKLAVPSSAVGKKIRCPKCQTVVAITAEMIFQPPQKPSDSQSVPAVVSERPQRPEVSLGAENTYAGPTKKNAAPESLGDQATFGGKLGSDDVVVDNDMEIVDLSTRYTIEGVLGKGGMGEVQLATDNRLKRKVAIKRVLGDMAKSQTAVRRFMTEAQSIAALNHPNIVQVYDYGRDKDGPFLILEYVEGKTLLDRCQQGAIPLSEAITLICHLCDGLTRAHELGIIHRDLKPANVLLTKDGIPKLTDFGLARVETGDTGQTMSGAVLGTLDFMPPEQRRDATQADARSDLWSLAATLYQMVTGKSPKVIRLNEVPASLQSAIGKALEDKPDDRYQSVAEFRNVLREVVDESRATLTNLTEGQCPFCATKNEAHRKFCRKCAVSLEVKCLSCSKGVPVWDEVCGSCGTKQSPLITSRKEQLQQRQHMAEGFLQEGKFREAVQIAEELQSEADPRFQHLKKWAAEFAEDVKRQQQQQQQRSGVLHKEAKTHQAAHDYSSAIHAIEQIPASLRSPDISAMLNQLQTQEQRSKDLYEEIRLRVERRELDGLMPRVDELLQLLPDRVDLRDLRDTLEKREQQRLASRSSATTEAQRLLDARKYAECVAVLQRVDSNLRTPEIEALQKDAASKLSRLEKLQKTIDQAVKNNQLQGLLAKVEELLLLKSDFTEVDRQLREQLLARQQKQKSQIKSLLQKVQQLRKESRFDEALEMLRRVPEKLQTNEITTAIEDLQRIQRLIPNHLVKAILSTCCFYPFGIVAIVFAVKVNRKLNSGDYAGAQKASERANMWGNLAIAVVIVGYIVSILVLVVSSGGADGPAALDDSLAKTEKARKDAEWSKPAAKTPRGVPQSGSPSAPTFEEAGQGPQKGTFTVKAESSAGDFTIEVHRDWAPIGAERFYQLVKAGYYDQCRYFRVLPGFMVQFGMNGDPAIQREWERNINDDSVTQSNKRSYVTFATSGANSRTTQVFINFDDNASLDAQGFAPFGRVIEGMENVDAINSRYGESPDQGSITSSGNAYLQQNFPELDFVKKMSIVSETPE